ncbi:hypothetical protein KSP39_PZI019798 [Platanthera zijinensis]|uniref:Uncharacterized protein n=1 Tax=Platanthera zijinensis TaxID=2320716 RepID=A0AAP0B110_9ASPA
MGNKEKGSREVELGSIINVICSPTTRLQLILMLGINFVCAIIYYGLSIKTNLFLTVNYTKWVSQLKQPLCSQPFFLAVCFYSAIDPLSPRGSRPHPLDRSSRAPRRRQREVLGALSPLLSGHRKRLRTEMSGESKIHTLAPGEAYNRMLEKQ